MAQVGRISGPLLTANLERNGIDLKFRDTLDKTSLLYFDASNNRIGINTNTVTDVDIQTVGTTRVTDLLSDEATKGNINFSNNDINVSFGDLNFNAQEAIQASTLETDQYFINDNYISTKNSNANIDLVPNGTGRLIVGAADSTGDRALNVRGDLHATGDITFEGNIIFGDDSTVDTVTFDADIKSDIIPDAHWTFNIGSAAKRWRYLSTELVNGEDVYTSALAVNGVNIEQRVGNVFYVSVNGDDTNTGDHVQDPFKTIKHALAQCDPSTTGPVEIVIFPGDYQEELPLEVPSNVTVTGADLRNTIIRPDTSSQSEDVFLMNGESTVQHLTIKDFFYDSINDKGYAFRFAPNTVVTSRSPYIQNVTVITQGSTITADDPRGFASGDAGKGALVDGADVLSTSNDASMLFHSVTFITPGVDALTMTNGVKVEWLNSFSYFANRGLYAVNGATGHLSTDGSTTLFGAELRSIGSANVYGNYGAVADGDDCLMYLVMHNFGYIGAGKLVDNDNYNYIQANEVVELNSGVIRYQSTNHQGNFRVGDNFLVDFETGSTTLDISTVETDSFAGISITTGPNSTLITGDTFEVGNFNIRDNEIDSLVGDINIDAATNVTNIASNVLADGDLAITGSFSYGGDLEIGDTPVDTIDFNVEFTQDLNPNTTETYSLGTETSVWKNIRLGAANIGDIQINDNYITTDVSNADLELRASGTGIIQVPNSLTAEQDFTANGTTEFIQDITVYGTLSLIGDNEATAFRLDSYERSFRSNTNLENTRRRQFRVDSSGLRFALGYSNSNPAPTYAIGDYIAIAEAATPDTYLAIIKILSLDSANTVNAFASNLVWNIEIIEGNLTSFVDRDEYIVKVSEINTFSDDFNLDGNFSVGQNLTVGLDGIFETISLKGNVITTEVSNSDLELRANGVGNIVIPYSDTVIDNNIEINGTTYSSDWNVATQVEAVTLTNDTIDITNNEIKTVISNANLDLTAAPNGIIDISNNDVVAGQDFSVSGDTTLQKLVTVEEDSFITLSSTLDNPNAYDTSVFDLFGWSVAISGDYAIVGAYNEDDAGGTSSGKAYIFDVTTGSLVHTLDNPNAYASSSGDQFGYSVAISGNNAIVGAPFEDEALGNSQSGKAYIFDVTTGSLVHTLDNPNAYNTSLSDRFSESVAISDDYAIVGARSEDDAGGNSSGKVYIFDVSTGSLVYTLDNPNAYDISAGDNFGYSVAISDNYAIIGASFEDDAGGLSSGKAYIFDVTTGNLLHTLDNPNAYNTSATDEFGYSVAISGNNAIVGARLEDDAGGSNSGKAYIFDVITGNLLYTLDNPNAYDTSAGDQFGWSVAISGDYAIVGAYGEGDTGGISSGKSYIFEIVNPTGTTLSPVDVNVTGTLTQTGNRTQTGNTTITGNLSTDNFTLDRNIQLENIEITGNLIHTTVTDSDLDFRANGTGRVVIEEDLHVTQNVNIGTLTANVINIAQDVDLNEIIIDGTVELDENVITTTDSNADLELRASGTGIVNVATNDVEIDNDLTVNSFTDIDNTNITGTLTRTGNTTQTGNVLITGTVTLDGQIAVDRGIDLEEISIDTNVITTTTTNANLELRAAGTGLIRLEDVQVNNNFSAGSLNDVQSITVQNTVQLDTIDLSTDTQLTENVITTTNSNSNLELRANGTGDVLIENNLFANNNTLGTKQGILTVDLQTESATITSTNSIVLPKGTTAEKIGTTAGLRFNTDTNLIGGQGSVDTINFGGVYSSDGLTGISVTSSDDIQIFVDGYSQDSTNKVGEITGNGVRLHGLQVDDILFDQNEIRTNVSNSNLDIVTNGTGSITIDDFTLKGNTISVPADTNIEFKTSGDSFRWVEFEGDKAIKWPAGPASSRPTNPVLGLTRVNTDTGELETWVGDQWRTSAGEFASISEADMEEEAFIQTLIYG